VRYLLTCTKRTNFRSRCSRSTQTPRSEARTDLRAQCTLATPCMFGHLQRSPCPPPAASDRKDPGAPPQTGVSAWHFPASTTRTRSAAHTLARSGWRGTRRRRRSRRRPPPHLGSSVQVPPGRLPPPPSACSPLLDPLCMLSPLPRRPRTWPHAAMPLCAGVPRVRLLPDLRMRACKTLGTPAQKRAARQQAHSGAANPALLPGWTRHSRVQRDPPVSLP
jgi:hypothetical protein